ncbi:hypothetical protein D3C72_1289590 [compost metagenome]
MRESLPAANVVAVVPCKLAIVTSVGAAAAPVILPFKVFAAMFASRAFVTALFAIVNTPVFDSVALPLMLTGAYSVVPS